MERLRSLLPPAHARAAAVGVPLLCVRLRHVYLRTAAVLRAALALAWRALRSQTTWLCLGICRISGHLTARTHAGPVSEALRRAPPKPRRLRWICRRILTPGVL